MTKPIILEGTIGPEDVTMEDGGKTFLVDLYDEREPVAIGLWSYEEEAEYPYPTFTEEDTKKGHARLREFVVRVTVEVIE